MEQLPDEKALLELLLECKELEIAARELSEMSTAFAYKWQKRAAGTYSLEEQKRLCEILDVELPLEARAVKD
jgi:hypothetical protein